MSRGELHSNTLDDLYLTIPRILNKDSSMCTPRPRSLDNCFSHICAGLRRPTVLRVRSSYVPCTNYQFGVWGLGFGVWGLGFGRSEEHTSELQSQSNLVC